MKLSKIYVEKIVSQFEKQGLDIYYSFLGLTNNVTSNDQKALSGTEVSGNRCRAIIYTLLDTKNKKETIKRSKTFPQSRNFN